MLNLIKRLGIQAVDVAHKQLDPYDDFKRPFSPPQDQISLIEKAEKAALQLRKDFAADVGVYWYNKPEFDWEGVDFGDQAIWQGLTTVAQCVRHGVLKDSMDPQSLHLTEARADAEWSLQGMKHQRMTPSCCKFSHLIRGRNPKNMAEFADDCSNDSCTGHAAGLYFAAKCGPTSAAMSAIDMMRDLADQLTAHNYALVRMDGAPTTHGKLINGVLTDPQRSSLAMMVFKAAAIMTGRQIYRDHFFKLYRKYGALLEVAEFKFLDYTKTHEAHRCAIHLHILADLSFGENPQIYDRCVEGLRRIWSLHRKTRDPWIAALVNQFWKISPSDLREVVLRLYEYSPSLKPANIPVDQSADAEYWRQRGVRFIKVADKLFGEKKVRASQPLPYHKLPSQDFYAQRHPYMCKGGGDNPDTKHVRHHAVDFLAPYWFFRKQGVIGPND